MNVNNATNMVYAHTCYAKDSQSVTIIKVFLIYSQGFIFKCATICAWKIHELGRQFEQPEFWQPASIHKIRNEVLGI